MMVRVVVIVTVAGSMVMVLILLVEWPAVPLSRYHTSLAAIATL